MKKFTNYQDWYNEYERELNDIFSYAMHVLKTKHMVYKNNYSFNDFCHIIYINSSKY